MSAFQAAYYGWISCDQKIENLISAINFKYFGKHYGVDGQTHFMSYDSASFNSLSIVPNFLFLSLADWPKHFLEYLVRLYENLRLFARAQVKFEHSAYSECNRMSSVLEK